MNYIIFNINTGLNANAEDFIEPFDRKSVATGDIERLVKYKEANPREQKEMLDKKINQVAAIYYEKAKEKLALYALSGQILTISYYSSAEDKQWTSYINENKTESDLIREFWSICQHCELTGTLLVGWRSNYFDIPYITQRSFVNNIAMSELYNGKWTKEWIIDCYDLWMRGSQYNNRGEVTVSNGMRNVAKAIGVMIDKRISEKFGYYFINQLDIALEYADLEIDITKQFYQRLTNYMELQAPSVEEIIPDES